MNNPLKEIQTLGQSIWLDYIRRDLISSGKLKYLIEDDGLLGITSNPSIFEKAIAESNIYDNDIREMASKKNNVNTIYEFLSQRDVQNAADEFRTVYEKTNKKDGYVSLEVNPHLANDTKGTIEEARRLWAALDRRNVLIKVPATLEGLPAIQQLISEGINVNVTLLFGLTRYLQVTEAYISGLEMLVAKGQPIDHLSSVASFFLSRIDSLVDVQVEESLKPGNKRIEIARKVHGKVAIASAKLAYQMYKGMFFSDRFKRLADKGAHVQRLLWASTSTKNPAYSDVKYVESLIGVDTINTMPPETLNAYRHHGEPKLSLEHDSKEAKLILESLPELGINLSKITQTLEEDGVKKFKEPFDKLMETLKIKSNLKEQLT